VVLPFTTNTTPGQPLSILVSQLLAQATDPDGDPLTVTGVVATSAEGGAVSLASGVITYRPASGFTGADSFSYTVSDGRGGTVAGQVSIAVATTLGASFVSGPVLEGGAFVVRLEGFPGYTYTIEFTDRLSPANWQKRINATVPTTAGTFGVGVFEFREPIGGTVGNRYYRTVWPPY
jgi:hypothetical protein